MADTNGEVDFPKLQLSPRGGKDGDDAGEQMEMDLKKSPRRISVLDFQVEEDPPGGVAGNPVESCLTCFDKGVI